MAYDYSKRISLLKQQTDEERAGRWSFLRAFFTCFAAMALLFAAIRMVAPSDSVYIEDSVSNSGSGLAGVADRLRNEPPGGPAKAPVRRTWQERTKIEIQERYQWLAGSLFGESSAQTYLAYSEWVIDLCVGAAPPVESDSMFDLGAWVQSTKYAFAGALLRIGFLLIAFWKYWVVGAMLAYFGARFIFKPSPTDDMLGICNPHKGPYYSGIWAKFIPNHSYSGTNFACPSLACPKQVSKAQALKHKTYGVLRQFHAVNETNIGLLRVILAYPRYPSYVPEERSAEEAADPESIDEDFQPAGVASTDCPTIEQAALLHLTGALEAHHVLQRYREMVHRTGPLPDEEAHFRRHEKAMQHVAQSMSPLGAMLVKALTPALAESIAELPPQAVATAVLAIEAGKVLTFEEIDSSAFSQVSLFPHLQARAVMRSMPSYIREYDGDMRYQIRQAIYCARRHGDFGRTFLPMTMQPPSRALRDWLEMLYASEANREETAHLVELDGHINELHANWRNVLARKVRDMLAESAEDEPGAESGASEHLWLGVPYKSVVLMPLRGLLRVGLNGVSEFRQNRIRELIELTRARTASLSISAGLPGFKRQAEEVSAGGLKGTGVTRKLADSEADHDAALKWLVVRRMLTKYNWLSTRVGDDAVPIDGLVQGVLTMRAADGSPSEVIPLDALVPLRQRRFQQLLGDNWQRQYYADSPKERDVLLVTDTEEFDETLKRRMQEVKEGTTVPPAVTA